ncbi:MAG TPA: fused response regulator/phosphatase [Streptosporangiaceae bacterium]|jgi:CheY-like chemotaxis protein
MNEAPAVVLVVDDNEAKRYLMASWLRRGGHTIVQAATGEQALARLDGVDLVVLDVRLPDISGIDVCERVKGSPRTAAIPVVQVSAAAVAVADRARGLNRGADAYLTDPIEPEELLATVEAALRYYRARRRAERTAARLAALTQVTLALNAAGTFDGMARTVASGAVRIFEVPAVHILVHPDGQLHRMSASPDETVARLRGGHTSLAENLAGQVLRPGEDSAATIIPHARWRALFPDTVMTGDVCLAAARTKSDGLPVMVGVAREGVTGEDEMQILRQLTQLAALAVEALRAYAEEHLIALTLQRSFLPSALPEVPGIALSARYAPASDQAEIGGDFYEALLWQDQVLAAIGDVQGHSLQAAIVMGELRHALRAFAGEGHGPVEISRLLNDVLRRYHPGIVATLCLLLLDPGSGALQIVNCGHIPPLLVGPGQASYTGQGGLLLGLPMHDPHVEHVQLPAGGTVLLVTDGLIEDRNVFLDVNMERLRVAAEDGHDADLEAFSDRMLSMFGLREDDVALIALRQL